MSPTADSITVRIEGYEMPGRFCACVDEPRRADAVHVGVQRRSEVIDRVPGDATSAEWTFDVTVRRTDHGLDFGGPHVHGRRGERFIYLSWGTLDPGDDTGHSFAMFRRAKLLFADAGDEVLAAACRSGTLVCRVRMTDDCGNPRCARVREPDASWSAG